MSSDINKSEIFFITDELWTMAWHTQALGLLGEEKTDPSNKHSGHIFMTLLWCSLCDGLLWWVSWHSDPIWIDHTPCRFSFLSRDWLRHVTWLKLSHMAFYFLVLRKYLDRHVSSYARLPMPQVCCLLHGSQHGCKPLWAPRTKSPTSNVKHLFRCLMPRQWNKMSTVFHIKTAHKT